VDTARRDLLLPYKLTAVMKIRASLNGGSDIVSWVAGT